MRHVVAFAVAIALLLPFTAHADAVFLSFGEMIARQGSSAEGSLSFGPVMFAPWISLDGGQFEGMPMIQFGGTPDSLVIGPLVGSINSSQTGAKPYFGAEIRGKLQLWRSRLIFRLAERHTREALLSRFANVGIESGPKACIIRVSYQPIERNHGWTHRLALKATTPYKSTRIGLEVRSNLDITRKKAALADISIPLR